MSIRIHNIVNDISHSINPGTPNAMLDYNIFSIFTKRSGDKL